MIEKDGMSGQFKALRPLQVKQSEILQDLDKFCEQYHIAWCLAYGSALGARRHGGPIPWDDDVDILMTADSYKQFKKMFIEHGNHEKYYLQEKVIVKGMVNDPKIRLNNTTFIEDAVRNMDMHHGIYIDIFILHNVPQTRLCRMLGRCAGIYMDLKTLSNQHYINRRAFIPLMAFLRLFPRDFGMKTALRLEYSFDRKPSNQMMVWCIGAKPYSKDVLFPFRKMNYDGMPMWVPNNIEKYLEITYGDWKKIPDMKSILWHQHAAEWKLDEDFRKYAPNVRDFSDEMGSKDMPTEA